MRPGTFGERFWSRVTQRGPDDCWPWTGTTNGTDGRGKVHIRYEGLTAAGRPKRVQAYAYAVSWELSVGPIPDGLFVLHHCDNGNCVNPAHLFLGTQADNVRDMHQKGRADSFGHLKERLSGFHINRRRGERIHQRRKEVA